MGKARFLSGSDGALRIFEQVRLFVAKFVSDRPMDLTEDSVRTAIAQRTMLHRFQTGHYVEVFEGRLFWIDARAAASQQRQTRSEGGVRSGSSVGSLGTRGEF